MSDQFADVFDGKLGTLPETHHPTCNDTVMPVVMANHRTPIAVRLKLKITRRDILVADVLSWAPRNSGSHPAMVNSLLFLLVKPDNLSRMRCSTQQDSTMTTLKSTITDGRPDTKESLAKCVTLYFNYRDELTVQDGIVM